MFTIKAKKRELVGKKVKSLRGEALIPASVYGPKRESLPVVIDYKEFEKAYAEAGHSEMINLEVEGEKEGHKIFVKEVQINPLTQKLLHVSLYQVDMESKITIEVPIHYEGVPHAVKINLGFLVTPVNEVLLRGLPAAVPGELVVNVENLMEIGDSVLMKDIKLPEHVEFDSSVALNNAVAYIAPPQKEIVEEEKPVEAAEGEEGAEGAVEGEEGAEGTEGEGAEGEKGEAKGGEKAEGEGKKE